jgi:hypothetical protein
LRKTFDDLNASITCGNADQEALTGLGELHNRMERAEEIWLGLLEEQEQLLKEQAQDPQFTGNR